MFIKRITWGKLTKLATAPCEHVPSLRERHHVGVTTRHMMDSITREEVDEFWGANFTALFTVTAETTIVV